MCDCFVEELTLGWAELVGRNVSGRSYAGYDATADAFHWPQPHASWTLNKTTYLWEAPVEYPSDGKLYVWNEDKTSWDAVE